MLIYREILNEGKVILVSKESNLRNLTEIMKQIELLLYPLNMSDSFWYYESLSGIKLLELEKNFVAGFNNPIIKNYKIWTMYADLDSGIVIKNE